MENSYASLCDDFYVNVRLGTHLKMTSDRASVIAFFERVQRVYPKLVNFSHDERDNESCIQEDRVGNVGRWLSVGTARMAAGYVNPPEPADAYGFCKAILETVPHYLAVGTVDLDYMDVLWGFDFDFKGNHHELVAEALLGDCPMGKLMEAPNARGIKFDLFGIVSLSDDTRTHARVSVEPRTTAAQVRTGDFPDQPLSVCVILRQWSGGKQLPELHQVEANLIELGERFMADHVIEPFLSPIREAIARRR